MMRSQTAWAYCLCFVALCSMLAGCNSAPPPAAPEPPKVSVMHPEQRELTDHEEFNGWMVADKSVEVRARVKGHIKKIHFTDGQYVKKGDLLYELDPRPFEAEIARTNESMKVYEAQKNA